MSITVFTFCLTCCSAHPCCNHGLNGLFYLLWQVGHFLLSCIGFLNHKWWQLTFLLPFLPSGKISWLLVTIQMEICTRQLDLISPAHKSFFFALMLTGLTRLLQCVITWSDGGSSLTDDWSIRVPDGLQSAPSCETIDSRSSPSLKLRLSESHLYQTCSLTVPLWPVKFQQCLSPEHAVCYLQ